MKIIKIKLPPVITAANRAELADAVATALRKKPQRVVLDAADVVTASLNTQRFFLAVSKRVPEFSSGVAITNAYPTLYDMLVLTGVGKFIKISRIKKRKTPATLGTPKKRKSHAHSKK